MPAAPGGVAPTATFDWQGHPLVLLAAKAVWDPQRQVLFVADLHLGKAETFVMSPTSKRTISSKYSPRVGSETNCFKPSSGEIFQSRSPIA